MRRYIQWKVDRVGGQDWVSLNSNNQDYESQIRRSLDRMDKCRRFNIAIAIREAHVDFCSLVDDPDPENNDNDDGLSENPEEDPLSITRISPATPITGTIQ